MTEKKYACSVCGKEGTINDFDATETGRYCSNECLEYEWLIELPNEPLPRIVALTKIEREHKFAKIDGYLVDPTTASLLVGVYKRLKGDEARAKFEKINLLKLIDFAWKAVPGYDAAPWGFTQ